MKNLNPYRVITVVAGGRRTRKFLVASVAIPVLVGGIHAAMGDPLTWEPQAGSTTWDTVSSNFYDSSVSGQSVWIDGSDVTFGTAGGGDTVNVNSSGDAANGGAFLVNSITFSGDAYTLTGGTLDTDTITDQVNSATNETINSNIVSSGTLNISSTVANAHVVLGGTNTIGNANLTSGGSTLDLILTASSAAPTGTITVEPGATYTLSNNQNNGNIDVNAIQISNNKGGANERLYIFSSAGSSFSLNDPVTSTVSGNTVSFSQAGYGGQGVVLLNAASTYTGTTDINPGAAGVVRLGVANALPTNTNLTFGGITHTVQAAGIGSLDLNGNNQSVVSLASDYSGAHTGNGINNSSTSLATLTITGAAATTFGLPIGLPTVNASNFSSSSNNIGLALTPSGAGGALALSAANTYTGPTSINGGTLALAATGSLGDTAITVNSGGNFTPAKGSFAGSAANGASLNLAGGAINLVDANAGNFTLNGSGTALTLNGGTLNYALVGGGIQELLLPTGNASVSGTNTVNVSTALTSLTAGSVYTLIGLESGGGLTGNFDFSNGLTVEDEVLGSTDYQFALNNTDTAETLTVTLAPTPEPVGLSLLGVSAAGLLLRPLRRRRPR